VDAGILLGEEHAEVLASRLTVIGQVQYLSRFETGVFYNGRYVPLPALGGDGSATGQVPPAVIF